MTSSAQRKPFWTTLVVAMASGLVLSIAVALGGAWFGRGTFEHLMLALGLVWAFLPLIVLVLLGFALAFLRRGKPSGKTFLRLAGISATLALVTLFGASSYLPGRLLGRCDVLGARSFCRQLIPRVEAHRARHGSYPTRLADLEEEPGARPRLLAEDFYFSNGEEFGFDFADPAGLMNGYRYSSKTDRWHSWD